MKFRTMIISASIALATLSCTKENPQSAQEEGPLVTFTAISDTDAVPKTDLSGDDENGYVVLWTAGDKIRLQGAAGGAPAISGGAGTTQGTFSTTVKPAATSPAYMFIYPANYPTTSTTALSILNQNPNVGNQGYKANGPDFFPMYAQTDDQTLGKIQFSNLLGIIRVRIQNSGNENLIIKKLDYAANKSLIGSWDYELTEDGHYKAVLRSGKPLSLDCGDGVTIEPGQTKPFFVSAFDGDYSTLNITVTNGNDRSALISLKAGKTFSIRRSRISDIAVKLSSESFTAANEIMYEASSGEILDKYPAGSNFPTSQVATVNPQTYVAVTSHIYDSNTGKGVITLAEGINTLGYQAFADCEHLTKVTIPSSVTIVGQEAFRECTALPGVKLPKTLKTIQTSAFKGCTAIATIDIPSTVTVINTSAFEGSGLTAISLPEGLTTLGASAFLNCAELQSVSVPNTVTSFGNNLFQNCAKLTTVNIPDNSSVTKLNQNLFNGCASLVHVDIPANIVTMGTQVFYNCALLESADISNITSFDANGGQFYGCAKLEALTFNPAIPNIPKTICKGCKSITEITVPATVVTIGHQAFNGCSNLEYVTFLRYDNTKSYPETVSSRLVSTTYNVDQFSLCPKLLVEGHMIVPKGSLEDYKKAWTWEETWGATTYKGSYADYFKEDK